VNQVQVLLNFVAKSLLVLFTLLVFQMAHSLKDAFAAEPKKLSVVVQEVKNERVAQFILVPASLEIPAPVSILSDSDGIVQQCRVQLGSSVSSGMVLCLLKKTDPGYTTAPVEIRSHVSGKVSEIFVNTGTNVSKQDKIVTVIRPELANVVAHVPALSASSIALGVEAELETLEGKVLGKVELKAKAPAPDQTTATVRMEFISKGWNFDGFHIGRLKIPFSSKSLIQIPESAISYESNKPFVKLLKEKEGSNVGSETGAEALVTTTEVELGSSDGERVEVLKGLKQGDRLIIKSSGFVKSGDTVSVQDTGARASK
jgi:multidrug efflux pump subunit AcrA (membrane-fusion protein)